MKEMRKRQMPCSPGRLAKKNRCEGADRNVAIPHVLFLSHIIPSLPIEVIEEMVFKAVLQQNLSDLFFLIGRTKDTVPFGLSGSEKIIKAAGKTIMLPIICSLGFNVTEDAMNMAVVEGNVKLVKLLNKNGCPWSARTFTIAVKNRNFEMMQCLLELGCPLSDTALSAAAKNGDLESMKWLKAHGCPWSQWTFRAAARKGDLDIMKWLRLNGCPWDQYVFMAAECGNLDNMKWLRSNGCPWCTGSLWQAKHHGKVENVEWLKENGLSLMYY
jgi:hypothetical protein